MPRAAPQPRLADPGALLSATHELDDGGRVRLRLARPTDSGSVREFLEGLDPETRRRRFLHPMPTIDERTVRHFTFYDPRARLTIAATVLAEGSERIVGLADAAFLETGLAEIGIVVDDDHRRRGLGKLLSEAVASLAIRRGAAHLKAEMLPGNAPMLRLFERLGRTVRTVEDGTSTTYVRLDGPRRCRAAA